MASRQPPEMAADILLSLVLFAKVQNGDEIPGDWDKGAIIPIPKKVALTYCKNLLSRMTK